MIESETLLEIAKIVARKVHSDQSTSIDVFLDNGDFYQINRDPHTNTFY